MTDDLSQPDSVSLIDYTGAPEVIPSVRSVPNFWHTCVFFLIALVALFAVQASLYAFVMSHHIFANETAAQLQHEPLLIVPSEAISYLLSLVAATLIFTLWWRRPFAAGIQWNVRTALHRVATLFAFGLALGLLLEWLSSYLPIPKQLPLDQFFRTRVEVWLAALFGIFIAPAFEEIAFRGFLLPSLERFFVGHSRPQSTAQRQIMGRTAAVLITSALFAALHATQLAKAWVPLLIIFSVSVVLCLVRMRYKSVAASALVHAAYNASIFILVFIGTDGFRHLDKLKPQ